MCPTQESSFQVYKRLLQVYNGYRDYKDKRGVILLIIYLAMLDTEEDKHIFIELHDEYSQVMYKKAYSVLRDSSLAEDVVQESFIRVVENFDKIIKKKCPQTRKYFVNIVRSISIDVYRKRKKQQVLSFDEFEGTIADRFENIEGILDEMEMEKYFLQLPKSYYVILSLKYDDGYTYKEIASILDITEENVKKRLFRARNKLREILAGQEVKI